MTAPNLAPRQLIAERFHLERPLDGGRLGELWLATDWRSSEAVVVRFLSPYLDRTPGFRARFLVAGERLCQLDHPGLARGIAAGLDEYGRPLVVSGYVPGTSLAEWVDEREVSPRDALMAGAQICLALHYLHGCGVVHGDLRPSAVRVRPDGHCALVDPGFPVPQTREGDEESPRWVTRAYTALDVSLAGPTPATDLYSVAAILYALIRGEEPTAMGWDLTDRLPSPIASALTRAVSMRSDLRFESAEAMATALAQVAATY